MKCPRPEVCFHNGGRTLFEKTNGPPEGGPPFDYTDSLEVEAQGELHVPDVARLSGDLSKLSAGRIEVRAAPVRVVEGVERLRPELKAHLFADGELLEQPQVPVLESRLMQKVARTGYVVEGILARLSEQ